MNTLGERLKKLRESSNLMQREVGTVINVDGAFISKIENNEKTISRSHLKTLSIFFSVKEDELHTLWLADKIRVLIKGETLGRSALTTVLKDFEK
ncbi:helix-turn-helix domain-containing protein [Sphingobacterium spiritivorum]|uniref:helix-turn-helix domain-containing protein n=1 Tax=Sphingobacterium spiritivorum TaxID=258 RepID=UPI003DA246BD